MDISNGENLNEYLNRIDSFTIDGNRQLSISITADPSNIAGTNFTDVSELVINQNFGGREFDPANRGEGLKTGVFEEGGTVAGGNHLTNGVINAKLAADAVETRNIVDGAVTTAKIEDADPNDGTKGVQTADFAQDSVTTDKLESADTTSTNKARIDVAIASGPSGTIIVEADSNYNGVLGSLLRIEIAGVVAGGGGAEFDADDFLIRLEVKEGVDDVADVIGYLSGLANFTASSSTITGGDLNATIAAISELSVHALASGTEFCDRSPDENTDAAELAASGIQSVKIAADLENSDFSTSAIDRRVISSFGTGANSYGELLMGDSSGDVIASLVKGSADTDGGGNLTARGNLASSNGVNVMSNPRAVTDTDAVAHNYSNITQIGTLQPKLRSELTLAVNESDAVANGLALSDASDVGLEMTSDTVSVAEHHISGLPAAGASQVAWSAQDLVTKEYVESVGAGSQWKEPVRLASNEDFTGATEAAGVLELHPGGSSGDGTLMIDGKKVLKGDRVLFFGMSGANAGLNGIYRCSQLGISKHFKIIFDADNGGNHASDIAELTDTEFALDMFAPAGNQTLRFRFISDPSLGVTGDNLGGNVFAVQMDGTSSMDDIAFEMDSLFGQSFTGGHLQDSLFTEATVSGGLVEFKLGFMHTSQDDQGGQESSLDLSVNSQSNLVTLQLGDSGFNFSSMPAQNNSLAKMNGGAKPQFGRADDADSAEEIIGLGVFIEEGDYYSDVSFHCTSPDSDAGFVLNTTALTFVQKTAIGMHQGDNVGIEIQPDAKSIRIKDLGLKASDLEMSIVRKHIRGFYTDSSDPVNIELGIEGGSDDVAIVKEAGVETILSDADNDNRYLLFAKYAYNENLFTSAAGADTFIGAGSLPVTNFVSTALDPSPLVAFQYQQVFLNGVLLRHASDATLADGDYVLVEGNNGVLFDTAGAVDPNTGAAFADGNDEFASSPKPAAPDRGPDAVSTESIASNPPTSVSDENALVLKIDGEALSPGDILEFRIFTRHRHSSGLGGFNA